jgi:hypothetical protein
MTLPVHYIAINVNANLNNSLNEQFFKCLDIITELNFEDFVGFELRENNNCLLLFFDTFCCTK